jgi:hypothetical protein
VTAQPEKKKELIYGNDGNGNRCAFPI